MNFLNLVGSRILRSFAAPLALIIGAIPAHLTAAPPTGFAVEQLLTGLQQPMAMRFLPDERLLVAQKKGFVRISDVFALPVQDDIYMDLANTALHPDGLNSGNERGVLDLCLDPNFPTEAWVYVLYTPAQGPNGAKLRVSRFPHLENAGGVTSRADMANEEILWEDTEGYDSCCHFGGGLDFGPDGNLWFATGDHFQGAYAASITRAGGGVHRITKTGGIPADNPFVDGAGPNVDSLVAFGLRNPFRCRWDDQTNRLFIGEVGGNAQDISWEDVHVITWDATTSRLVDADFGTASDNNVFDGINFGWPTCEGLAPYDDFLGCNIDSVGEPIFAYPHSGNTAAITGGVFNHEIQFPEEYENAYFYADSTRDFIRYLKFNTDGTLAPNPAPDPITPLNPDPLSYTFDLDPNGRIVALEMGPDGALYFVNFTDAGGAFGQDNPTVLGSVGRYVFDGGNNRPIVNTFTSSFTPGSAPVAVSFDIEATEPEGSPMTYFISYGDGQDSGAALPLADGSPITLNHSYTADGIYEVVLSISDGSRTTTSRLNVEIGTPPVITSLISSNSRPGSQNDMFRFGDTITFSAVATDAEDGAMGAANFTWNVQFVRPGNVHPAFGPESNLATLDFDIPVQGQGFRGNVFYRCFLTVTDSSGLSTTSTVDIDPEKVNITLDTVPSGIFVQVDGNLAEQTPFVLDTLVNFPHQMSVPSSQCLNGFRYEFTDWSTTGTDNPLPYPAPVADSNLTANFTNVGECTEPPTLGLALHLKGSQGVVLNGLGEVAVWRDQTSNNYDLIAEGEPALQAGSLNGQSYISFDGIDDAMVKLGGFNNIPTGSADRSVFMLVRYNQNSLGIGWGGFAYGNTVDNEAFGLTLTPSDSLGLQGWGLANDFEANPPINGIGRWVNQSVIYSGENFEQYDNGTVISSGTHTFNTGTDTIRLGAELSDVKHMNMDVAEILIYDRAVTEAERQQIEAYFEENYQIDVTRGAFPVVEITSPGTSETFSTGDLPLVLTATASDVEDGDLGSAIVWNSSVDGFLGTGASIPATLTVGVHTLTATVNDSDQLEGVSEISILISDGSITQLVTDGLVLQLEADLNIGLQSGTTVGAWLDQSGLGNDLIASGDPQLVTSATPSGLPSVSFDGSDDKLERVHVGEPIGGLPMGANARSMFIVTKYNSNTAWAGVAYGDGSPNSAFGLVSKKTSGELVLQGWGGGNDYVTNEAGIGAGWLVQSAIYDGGVSQIFKNGFSIGQYLHIFNTGLNKLVLGEEISADGSANMELSAVLLYDRALPESERLVVEAYLQNKYLQPPVPKNLYINTPAPGSIFFVGAPITLTANLVDLPVTTVVEWSSDLDGILGTGDSLEVSNLQVGAHTLTATATENGSVLETETVTITIEPINLAPTVVIGAPQDGAMSIEGTTVNLVGGALDPEDGSLNQMISWSSNLDGSLGTGASVNVNLSVGIHVITASVQDSGLKTASDSISVTIAANNLGNLVTSGLVFHLESDSNVNLQSGNSTLVSWGDLTLSGNDLIASGDPQLLANATPTGLPAIQFDGNDDKLERVDEDNAITGLPIGNANRTMVLLSRYNSSNAWGGATYGTGAVNQAFGLGMRHPSGELVIQGWGAGNDYISSQKVLGAGWGTQSVTLDANVATLYKGGQTVGTFAHNYNTTSDKLVIAEEIAGAGYLGMDVAAMLIYDRALSPVELADVEAYLQNKYLNANTINTDPLLEISLPADGSIVDNNEIIQLFATASNLPFFDPLAYSPTHDAYTQDGSNRNDGHLRVLQSPRGSVANRTVYLQYDLSGLDASSPPQSVQLKLKESIDVSITDVTLRLYRASSNGWNEAFINASSAPSQGNLVDTFTGLVSNDSEVIFDLSSEVAGPGIYSFILVMDETDSANDVAFYSKDNTSPTAVSPELSVVMPDPANVVQWTSSLDGPIGVGGVLSVQGLSVGTHVITAQLNGTGPSPIILTDSITLTVIDEQSTGLPVTSGLVLQLESSDGIQTSGNLITEWTDQSSEGNDLFALGDPELVSDSTPSGLAAVSLDGTGDKLQRLSASHSLNALPAGDMNRSVFLVANYQSTSAWAGLAYGKASTNKAFGLIANTNGKLALQGYGSGRDLISTETGIGEGWLIQSSILADNQAILYRDGTQIAQFANTYNTEVEKILLGEEIGGAGFAEMEVAAALIYDRALTPSERVSVENYLQQKYLSTDGSSVSLPLGNVPVITSSVQGPIVHEVGTECPDPGAEMVDAEDGLSLLASSTIVDGNTVGNYAFTYQGTDSDGNEALPLTIQVSVVDTAPARILVPNLGPILHMVGTPFVDPGATAIDAVDAPVSLSSSSTVNGLVTGTYYLTYNHVDSAGNASPTKQVEVSVLDLSKTPQTLTPATMVGHENDLMMSFESKRGFTYTVEATTDLVNWGPVTNLLGGDLMETLMLEDGLLEDVYIYRIKIEPEGPEAE